jgi:hypothetical protein|nr:MAG TPA: hypothetical protein [Caudoviricetes sp.]
MKTVFEFEIGMEVYDEFNFPDCKGVVTDLNNEEKSLCYPVEVSFDKTAGYRYYTLDGRFNENQRPTLATKPYEIEFKGFEQNHFEVLLEDIEEIKERLDALKKLTTIRDCYNEGWEPNWEDTKEKYVIKPYEDRFILLIAVKEKATLYFRSIEIATKFFEEQRKLLEIAKPLLL